MSDYLASLAARSINQNRGFRFLAGELRPRLASRFESPRADAAAWPEPLPSFEETTGPEAVGLDLPVTMPMAPLEQPDRIHQRAAIRYPVSAADLAPAEKVLAPLADEPAATTAHSTVASRSVLSDQHRPEMQEAARREKDGDLPRAEHPHPSPSSQPESMSERTIVSTALPVPTEHQAHYPQFTVTRPAPAPEQTARRTAGVTSQAIAVEYLPSQVHALDPSEPSLMTLDREQSVEPQQFDLVGHVPHPPHQSAASPSAPHVSVANAAVYVENVLANTGTPADRPASDQNRQVLQSTLNRLGAPGAEAGPSAVPTVNVTIGRVEVRAVPAPTPSASKPRATPAMTLDEYLQRRATGGSP